MRAEPSTRIDSQLIVFGEDGGLPQRSIKSPFRAREFSIIHIKDNAGHRLRDLLPLLSADFPPQVDETPLADRSVGIRFPWMQQAAKFRRVVLQHWRKRSCHIAVVPAHQARVGADALH